MTDSIHTVVERLQADLEALLAAVHADDPKRELLVRVGDAMREAKSAATLISELQGRLEQKNTPLAKPGLPGAERSGCENAIEIVARIIDPERWAVLDGYLAETKRKYRGQNVGYDLDAFKDRASMAKAIAILACPDVARAFGRQR